MERFKDWKDFVRRVARPVMEEEGSAEEEALALFKETDPYFVCACLTIMANGIERHEREATAAEEGEG